MAVVAWCFLSWSRQPSSSFFFEHVGLKKMWNWWKMETKHVSYQINYDHIHSQECLLSGDIIIESIWDHGYENGEILLCTSWNFWDAFIAFICIFSFDLATTWETNRKRKNLQEISLIRPLILPPSSSLLSSHFQDFPFIVPQSDHTQFLCPL